MTKSNKSVCKEEEKSQKGLCMEKVTFPDPDVPMTHTNSPLLISPFTPERMVFFCWDSQRGTIQNVKNTRISKIFSFLNENMKKK